MFSMASLPGRGCFPGGIQVDAPMTALAAFEGFVGLVIEVSFIAVFTQRFFARLWSNSHAGVHKQFSRRFCRYA